MNSIRMIHQCLQLSIGELLGEAILLAAIKERKESSLSRKFQTNSFSSLQGYLVLFQNHTESLYFSQQVDNTTFLLQLTFH